MEKKDPFVAIRNNNFKKFLLFRLSIVIGTQMQSVIIAWHLYSITKDVLSLGLIGLSEAIPFIATSFFSGYVADKFNRKHIVLYASSLLLATSLFLFCIAAYLEPNKQVFCIYLVMAIVGIIRAFIGPASSAIWGDLLPKQLYTNASTWNSSVFHLGAVIGPAIGGLACVYFTLSMAYLVNLLFITVALFIFASISYKVLKKEVLSNESLKEKLLVGIRFVFQNKLLLSAIGLDLFAVLFGGVVALLPVFASDVLLAGSKGFGYLRAAPAIGAVLMAIVLAYFPPTINAGKKLLICVSLFGLLTIFFALSTNFILSFYILMFIGAVDNVSVVLRSTIIQLYTPDHMRGRVSSVNFIFIGSSNEIGAFESGLAAKLLGLVPSVILGGIMTMLTVITIYLISPQLRKLNLVDK